jgi:RecT family protein
VKTASKRKPQRAITRRRKPRKQTALMRIAKPPNQPWNLTLDEVALVKNHIAKGATDKELEFCLAVARRHKLDPFRGQIWFVKRRDESAEGGYRWIPITGINGMLHIAARDHRDFGSNDEPEFGPMHTVKYQWNGKGPEKTIQAPEWALVRLWKKGLEHPIVARVFWSEIYPNVDYAPLVRQMPRLMLGKCALAQAVRRAYPATDGLYIKEEFQGPPEFTPGGRVMEITPVPHHDPEILELRDHMNEKGSHITAEQVSALPKEIRDKLKEKIVQEKKPSNKIAIISYPAKEDGDVELQTDAATAEYAGLKRPNTGKQDVWLIKWSAITKFHDMCRDRGIEVKDTVEGGQ